MVEVTPELLAAEHLELNYWLGMLTNVAAMMEAELRNAFRLLDGGEYAAVVAGGESVSWLTGKCRALAEAHAAMSAVHRKAIKDALKLCSAVSERRNTLIHASKFPGRPGEGSMTTGQSRRGTGDLKLEQWTIARIRETVSDVIRARHAIGEAVDRALEAEAQAAGRALG